MPYKIQRRLTVVKTVRDDDNNPEYAAIFQKESIGCDVWNDSKFQTYDIADNARGIIDSKPLQQWNIYGPLRHMAFPFVIGYLKEEYRVVDAATGELV